MSGVSDTILARYANVPNGPRALAAFCAILKARGAHEDALALGSAAVAQAPDDMEVRDMVRTALSDGVPRFHAPMLRDDARNKAYARAIERAVRPGMTVLEIGTGAGLLALMAARAGATVVTCEANPMIAAAARAIVERNGLGDRIAVIAKRSDALEIGVDLDAPADLLLHEIFGNSLFGEGVVPSLTDARRRLVKPDAVIVPPRAELRCALLRFDSIPRAPVALVEGFDLSLFELLRSPNGERSGAFASHSTTCSEPRSALRMDFTGPAPFGPAQERIRLQSTGGRIDAIVQWLRIDFGADEVLENNPFSQSRSHWSARPFDLVTPRETEAGEWVDVTVRHTGPRLTMTLEDRP